MAAASGPSMFIQTTSGRGVMIVLTRVATRYDKLAANYLAFIQLASIRLWLRANESAP